MVAGRVTEPGGPLTEKDFQRQVVELARMLGWHVYHPLLSKWSERGWPDLAMIRTRDRRLLFAELKRDGGKLTEHQEVWIAELAEVAYGPWGSLEPDPLTCPRVEVHVWHPADWDDVQAALR